MVAGVLLVAAATFFFLDLIQIRNGEYDIDVSTIDPHPGLIWLLSPGNPEPLLQVMRHHTRPEAELDERLRDCWSILSDHPAMEETYERMSQEMERWGIRDVALHPVYLPKAGVEDTHRAVRRIYEDEVVSQGLRPDQVVTDLTGGLKIMTAGALMACLPPSGKAGPIEYLISRRDPLSGEPIPGSECPIKLDITFFPRESNRPNEAQL